MSDQDEIRKSVSDAYGQAIKKPADKGCCSGSGTFSSMAGYSAEELAALPKDAVGNSFGCGNPLAMSEVREGETVLDLGSGGGIDLILAAKKVGPQGKVIGVDMTDDMLALCRKNIAASGLQNIEARKGIIEKLPVDSNSVDLVISNCVLNLSPEKDRVFKEIFRVLKPGGRILVSDIVAKDLPAWAVINQNLYNSCVAGAISEEDYLQGLAKAGLKNAAVRDRLIYDAAMLQSFLTPKLSDEGASCSCCAPPALSDSAREKITAQLAGKIWSAKIYAQKP